MRSEKKSGYAMTNRERDIALYFWNARGDRELEMLAKNIRREKRKVEWVMKEAESGLTDAVLRLEKIDYDFIKDSPPRKALACIRKYQLNKL